MTTHRGTQVSSDPAAMTAPRSGGPVKRNYERNAKANRRHLLPPNLDWCGCCGRLCVAGEIWCHDCAPHVTGSGYPWDQTWFAQHGGEACPFTDAA